MNYALDALWWKLQTSAVRDLAVLLTAPPPWLSGAELPVRTLLGEGGLGLSGGQSRRLALARLLLSPRNCWLLDEVSEGLDAVTAADVLQRLALAAEGRTMIFATHWQREARLADHIVCLHAGKVHSQALRGTPEFEVLIASLRADAQLADIPTTPLSGASAPDVVASSAHEFFV